MTAGVSTFQFFCGDRPTTITAAGASGNASVTLGAPAAAVADTNFQYECVWLDEADPTAFQRVPYLYAVPGMVTCPLPSDRTSVTVASRVVLRPPPAGFWEQDPVAAGSGEWLEPLPIAGLPKKDDASDDGGIDAMQVTLLAAAFLLFFPAVLGSYTLTVSVARRLRRRRRAKQRLSEDNSEKSEQSTAPTPSLDGSKVSNFSVSTEEALPPSVLKGSPRRAQRRKPSKIRFADESMSDKPDSLPEPEPDVQDEPAEPVEDGAWDFVDPVSVDLTFDDSDDIDIDLTDVGINTSVVLPAEEASALLKPGNSDQDSAPASSSLSRARSGLSLQKLKMPQELAESSEKLRLPVSPRRAKKDEQDGDDQLPQGDGSKKSKKKQRQTSARSVAAPQAKPSFAGLPKPGSLDMPESDSDEELLDLDAAARQEDEDTWLA
eukprot:CAMPEP_0204366808 /NCGR_PEP_ID=MMETSP0469-20131031/42955_1 /ASSEMBLY_ACC=CAM_ASM_000384 /TAXON_ID=2969 /ORGANISM="Oxyrrhis marina" /LENGTH=433 /DNA_ID=CAMNT_0051356081 /DNA_START=125 /DNA_END=1426 /DNA_ORIENTATION=-